MGVGKSHIIQAPGHQVGRMGYKVLYISWLTSVVTIASPRQSFVQAITIEISDQDKKPQVAYPGRACPPSVMAEQNGIILELLPALLSTF